jgi:hypothetical protein
MTWTPTTAEGKFRGEKKFSKSQQVFFLTLSPEIHVEPRERERWN